ncbi:hypothetical protein [Pediococcus argentinicus]|uniref:Uncharacterized protein n=1 Tax=Pediococcus argentinicus TaxID=480391 RepID=A0A0R2NK50_9LACO|nr:hypothetical protein [Pediococcus argentinicus]KRO26150.1 hypothetical protein IV88_GL000610 [Pediococcus argentinicus]NKZ21644.1 hypothetical protein [Pediococcus argentinicus]GEP18769.1 hypothetical protein LSA03_01530 [Pediococcus argentinicus]
MREYHWKYGLYNSLYFLIAFILIMLVKALKLPDELSILLLIALAILAFFVNSWLAKKNPKLNPSNYHSRPVITISLTLLLVVIAIIGINFSLPDNFVTFWVFTTVIQFIFGVFSNYWIPEKG